ncbi:O-methyltransferase [Aestuariibaculum suncheonense]|uniref:Class I SAM-dependent methyltransferase n=1 Tax=Aestuariibaculum suncheonense TaxID=1028745 RepID=A0A8J6UAM9_9FLAO|nr:class I SAM-dependent methyltransferase [Aestuariibaculum suncheonense]MBD0834587.1 class I SAM-dependent methyltransferase [Aestuariibaculum suncheonense]
MKYQVSQYLKFLIRSTNQHGVHSPFVYSLVTKCFYDRKNYPAYKAITNYRKQLISNKESITITDLGAGSHSTTLNTRSVQSIARHSGTPLKRTKLLYRLVNYLECQSVLELGTSLGLSTQAMALGNHTKITTVEGCPSIATFSKQHLQHLNNITLINSEFSSAIETLTTNTYDLVFFDGNHAKAATLNYFEALLESAHNDSVFIFDDIYWSEGMTEAWETIKQHPKVKVTIDTFYWGFVFFRKEQVKEHFTIRI